MSKRTPGWIDSSDERGTYMPELHSVASTCAKDILANQAKCNMPIIVRITAENANPNKVIDIIKKSLLN